MTSPTGRTIHKYRDKDSSLFKIIAGIVVLGVIAVVVIQISVWFQDRVTKDIETSATDVLANAESLIAASDHAAALALLDPILSRVDNPDITPKAMMLRVKLHREAGELKQTKDLLKSVISTYPNSDVYPDAAIQYAHLLENEGARAEALTIYKEIRDTTSPALRAPAVTALARESERTGDLDAARTMYNEAMIDAPYDSGAWREAASHLGNLNVKMLFSTSPTTESKVYTVMPGDSLTTIGSKFNITQGQLMLANGLTDPNTLRPNQTLKYTPKDFHIVIERATCRIFLMDREGIFKIYNTGLGKVGNETTLGKYKIGNKEVDPVWHKPGSEPIPPGHPENELGTRWLPMVPEEEGLPRDLGIHGTIQPDSIGTYSSKGCPRMLNREVEELYDLIVRSTPVQVVETFDPQS